MASVPESGKRKVSLQADGGVGGVVLHTFAFSKEARAPPGAKNERMRVFCPLVNIVAQASDI